MADFMAVGLDEGNLVRSNVNGVLKRAAVRGCLRLWRFANFCGGDSDAISNCDGL
jgi:hypothetical protein